MRQHALKAEVRCCTRGGVNAHVGHHAGDHQGGGLPFPQLLQQSGLAEAVGKMFGDDKFTRLWRHVLMNGHPRGIGQEEGGPFPGGDVLHMDHRQGLFPEGAQQDGSLEACLRTARQLHGSAGKVIVLNVDQQQNVLHGVLQKWKKWGSVRGDGWAANAAGKSWARGAGTRMRLQDAGGKAEGGG